MQTSKLDQLSSEVMELTLQPELAVIERRAGRRRARRRIINALGVVLTVQLAGALLWGLLPAGPARNTAAAPTAPSSDRAAFPQGPITWTGVGDGTHFYALLSGCGACDPRLVGSDDGGRTWTVRQAKWFGEVFEPQVRAAQTLLAPEVKQKPPVEAHPAQISTDGGRTWTDLTTSRTPATRVPAGGWLDIGSNVLPSVMVLAPEPHTLRVVDPVNRTIRPLATPPGITIAGVAPAPTDAGLWVTGLDGNRTPSVSVSRDGGVTWSTHSFGAVPNGQDAGSGLNAFYTMQVSTHDGQTVHVVVGNQVANYGYRSTDGGQTWKPTNGGAALPSGLDVHAPALTLPDGTHVLQQQMEGDGIRPLFSRDEASAYASENRPGWPLKVVHTSSDGSYTASDGRTIYRSVDGTNWSKTTPLG